MFDVSSVFIEGVGSAVPFPCRLMGVGLNYKLVPDDGSGVETQGTIKLTDGNGGSTLLEIPVIGTQGYPSNIFTGFADSDGYIRFDTGIWVDQTTVGVLISPLTAFDLILTYG